jgi:hypothetical protein
MPCQKEITGIQTPVFAWWDLGKTPETFIITISVQPDIWTKDVQNNKQVMVIVQHLVVCLIFQELRFLLQRPKALKLGGVICQVKLCIA